MKKKAYWLFSQWCLLDKQKKTFGTENIYNELKIIRGGKQQTTLHSSARKVTAFLAQEKKIPIIQTLPPPFPTSLPPSDERESFWHRFGSLAFFSVLCPQVSLLLTPGWQPQKLERLHRTVTPLVIQASSNHPTDLLWPWPKRSKCQEQADKSSTISIPSLIWFLNLLKAIK